MTNRPDNWDDAEDSWEADMDQRAKSRVSRLGESSARDYGRAASREYDRDYDGDQIELEERHALTRVAGMSTDLTDITEVEYRQLRLERVVLVCVWISGSAADAENAMAELKMLAETAGSQVISGLIQRRHSPDPATYIGSGKVVELKDEVVSSGADTVICDGELTAAQLRNLEDRVGVKVVDRTALILDIFAQHAKTAAGKLQVELAQLNYMKQRLRGWGSSLSRQVGGRAAGGVGIGGRGPGETKIETDRRRIGSRLALLRRQLRDLDATRQVGRQDRRRHGIASAALVGYTNAGKSSLLNRLTSAGVLVENALFATLDPTVRRCETPSGRVYTLTDTVGFIRHLPHELVEAFRSTLEETSQADLLVHVVDASDPDPFGQIDAVHAVLDGIGAGDIPELMVLNKIDLAASDALISLRGRYPDAVFCSALTGSGIDELKAAIELRLPRPTIAIEALIPWSRMDMVDRVHKFGEIHRQEHVADGTLIAADVDAALAGELADYRVDHD